jgi:hypothetical protein
VLVYVAGTRVTEFCVRLTLKWTNVSVNKPVQKLSEVVSLSDRHRS